MKTPDGYVGFQLAILFIAAVAVGFEHSALDGLAVAMLGIYYGSFHD